MSRHTAPVFGTSASDAEADRTKHLILSPLCMLNIMYQKSDGSFEGVNPVEFSDQGGKQRIAESFGFDNFEAFESAQMKARSNLETAEWAKQLQPITTTRDALCEALAAS